MAFLSAVLVAIVATCPAAAQEQRDTGAARALFEEGVRFVDAGEWAPAHDRFERALALHRSPRIAFNLATSAVHLGRFVEAMELFEQVRRDPQAAADARAASAREVEGLQGRIGRLVVRVTGPRAGMTIRVDGHPLPPALIDVAAPADPGPHAAVAERSGEVVAHGSADVPVGGNAVLVLTLPALAVLPAARPSLSTELAPTHTSGDVDWGWVGLAVGLGVAVVAAIVIGVVLMQPASSAPWVGDTSPGVLRW